MDVHNFKYTLKILLKNKMLIFWTLFFPIILGTLFKMAFQNIEKEEKLDVIPITIVKTEALEHHPFIKETLNNLSTQNEKQFTVFYETEEEAKKQLEKEESIGYFLFENQNPKIVIKKNGIEQTVFKETIEEILGLETVFQVVEENRIKNNIASIVGNKEDNPPVWNKEESIEQIKKSWQENNNLKEEANGNLSYTMIEFYTLIAMTCLYGAILSMTVVNKNLANQSEFGKRVSITPIKKRHFIFSSAVASFFVQLFGLFLLFIYTIFVLKVDYGSDWLKVIFLAVLGSFAGLSLGIFISTVFTANENTKVGIILSFTMFGCFLSGMMGITMKYVVDKNIPLLNQLNPANFITDGFYALYYYDTMSRFNKNVICLLLFSGILLILSIVKLRRQKYDHI